MQPLEPPLDDEGPSGPLANLLGLRTGVSRRKFLGRGSLLAGAAAAMAALPGFGALVSTTEGDAPAVSGAASEVGIDAAEAGSATAAEAGEPIVAHVVNASTGEINLYRGAQQITTRDPGLARALARLAPSK